ncbi:MAG: hypothetical protein JW815_04895 [Candidatus Bathyarchaeota archaeon]|nr:hypothetical protein [Candidatus Bathyarchaeum sp.]
MKQSKLAIVAILITVVAMVAPASAYIGSQNIETKAERMVDIAYDAQETIMGIVARVEGNDTAYDLLIASGLDKFFYDNVSLCVDVDYPVNGVSAETAGDGWTLLVDANTLLESGDYQEAIESAREALEIFREVLRSINDILVDAGIETGEILDAQLLQEAIDRSQDRITQLQDLIADEELLGNLTDAKNLLDEAQAALGSGELGDAKDALIEANSIISYVCKELRTIAQELNPGRITSYIAHARQYKEQFQERFGHAWNDDINVNALLKMFGYEDEEDFMQKLQQIINYAENNKEHKEAIREVIQNLKELGQMIKNMDKGLKQEYRNKGNGNSNGNGLAGSGKGYGNMGGGNSP